ncbi:MAG: glucosyl-3-phosphoglycerate phosphatase [Actinomycetota bacterium]|nr:glucosyl-3-phosphoglycerate phosphatase [Actinomycetota bacterium]
MSRQQQLVLVRHGRTAWNAEGRFQGQADPPLDGIGWDQARRAAVAIRRMAPRAVVSSDLRRAHQTAVMLGAACGLVPTTDRSLREVALGAWEGLDHDEAARRFPAEYSAWTAGADVRRGGGETQAEAGARVAAALIGVLGRAGPNSTVVAVSHGLALQAAMAVLAAHGLVRLDDARPPHLGNAEWIVLPVTLSTGRQDREDAA